MLNLYRYMDVYTCAKNKRLYVYLIATVLNIKRFNKNK